MTVTRPILAFPVFALLAACGGETPSDDGRSASGEVLEGTISDAMLPVDRVRSEAPFEDPEAFAEVISKAEGAGDADEPAVEGDEGDQSAAEDSEQAAPDTVPEAGNE